MDLRPLLGIISFLQQEEDDEEEDILAILSIIKFVTKNGNTPYRMSLLLKWIMKKSQIRLIREQRRTERIVLPGYAEMVFRYRDIQFAEDYRMGREKFQELLQIIGPALCETFINDGEPVKNKL
ncbi:Uncharacterized protein APZ42_006448, partial [Daphnia magna]